MTVIIKSCDQLFKLPVKFKGCSSDCQLDMDLIFPLCKQEVSYDYVVFIGFIWGVGSPGISPLLTIILRLNYASDAILAM